MIRTLLTTTALAALLTGGAMAQATTTATPAPGTLSSYSVTDSDNLATEIIGKQVYASAGADAEHIGDINNLVVGEDGSIQAVVIGVGGSSASAKRMLPCRWTNCSLSLPKTTLSATFSKPPRRR
jgi:hypothetical protein